MRVRVQAQEAKATADVQGVQCVVFIGNGFVCSNTLLKRVTCNALQPNRQMDFMQSNGNYEFLPMVSLFSFFFLTLFVFELCL